MLGNTSLINFKTNSWQDPGMVHWYAGRMVGYIGTFLNYFLGK